MEFFNFIEQNTTQAYIQALIIFGLLFIAIYIFRFWAIRKLERFSEKTKTKFDDIIVSVIKDIKWPLYWIIPIYVATLNLLLPLFLKQIIYFVFLVLIIYYAVKVVQNTLIYFIEAQAKAKGKDGSILNLVAILVKITLWSIAIILILSNLGYNVTSLIAGLGIGGIAIALAIQNVLSDVFSAFSIYLDKPFEIGDSITIGTDTGTIEKIGIKSTRIRTLQGEELVVSNNELTSIRIQNFKKMKRRRIVFAIGVTYNTSSEKLEKIPKIVEDIFAKVKNVELSRVHFSQLGDFSLNYEIVYHVLTREYDEYMDAQQKINLSLVKAFEQQNIEFAYPTQSIILEK